MATNAIGVSFLPSEDQQIMAPQPSAPAGDLGQAFKILSLRLPRVQGAPGITPPSNLQAPGSSGLGGGVNPHAAIFEAMIKAMLGGQAPMSGAMGAPSQPGPPHITPGGTVGAQFTGLPAATPTPPATPFPRGPFTRDGSY